MVGDTIYMDHNATTPTDPRVVEAMLPYFTEAFGNASSPYELAREPRAALERARETVAGVLGCRAREVIFTSGGSESDNMAIKGVALQNIERRGHIITSAIEHHAVLTTCEYVESRLGFDVTYLAVGSGGIVDPGDVRKAMRPDTRLVSIMHANNEIGTLQPLHEIAEVTKPTAALFHTDAVQAVGKVPVLVDELGVDLLSLSAHKFYGPKGVGALYVRAGVDIDPLSHGGQHERGMRPGTENVAGIVGLATALELCADSMESEGARLAALTRRLEDAVTSRVADVMINGDRQRRIPGTTNMSFRYVEGESIVLGLDMEGVAVSTGSACTTDSIGPSHVLAAMGVAPNDAQGSVRFGLGRHTSEADVDRAAALVGDVVERLRAISPIRRTDV